MARKKAARITRTPEEHRLYVQELDRRQRERSANGKANSKPRKPKTKQPRNGQQEKLPRLHEMKIYPPEYYQ